MPGTPDVGTYASEKVISSFKTHNFTGAADASFWTITPRGEGTQTTDGCSGEICRSLDPVRGFSCKYTCLPTSPDVAYLDQQYEYDQDTGLGIGMLQISNLLGKEVFSCAKAWVKNFAEVTYDKVGTMREYSFDTARAKWNRSVAI